jgi:hypothetical protein
MIHDLLLAVLLVVVDETGGLVGRRELMMQRRAC